MACLAWNWFAVWMGYLSFIIAKSKNCIAKTTPADPSSAAPNWYSYLLKQPKFNELWLDGLSQSAVCTFDWKTPQAGIVFQWSVNNRNRKPIEWYSKHNILLWFIWSNREEQAIQNNTDLNFLQPPDNLTQKAPNILFATPGLSLAGLIIQKYFTLGNNPIINKTIEFLHFHTAKCQKPGRAQSAVLNAVGSYKSDKVIAKNFENLLLLFQFEHVRRPLETLLVFSSLKSNSCRWVLGVHSATAALYIC
ncbi:hypothetical protein B0H34DRAFT_801121 [Crassisporium funariophilum]|nr:hypothetical protein B0H34DRAFT_801121 [Crassisporium funariophilum]